MASPKQAQIALLQQQIRKLQAKTSKARLRRLIPKAVDAYLLQLGPIAGMLLLQEEQEAEARARAAAEAEARAKAAAEAAASNDSSSSSGSARYIIEEDSPQPSPQPSTQNLNTAIDDFIHTAQSLQRTVKIQATCSEIFTYTSLFAATGLCLSTVISIVEAALALTNKDVLNTISSMSEQDYSLLATSYNQQLQQFGIDDHVQFANPLYNAIRDCLESRMPMPANQQDFINYLNSNIHSIQHLLPVMIHAAIILAAVALLSFIIYQCLDYSNKRANDVTNGIFTNLYDLSNETQQHSLNQLYPTGLDNYCRSFTAAYNDESQNKKESLAQRQASLAQLYPTGWDNYCRSFTAAYNDASLQNKEKLAQQYPAAFEAVEAERQMIWLKRQKLQDKAVAKYEQHIQHATHEEAVNTLPIIDRVPVNDYDVPTYYDRTAAHTTHLDQR